MTEPQEPSQRRLFLALYPPPDVVARLDALDRPERRGVRWVPPRQWHITLRFLGECDPQQIRSALLGFGGPMPRCTLGPEVTMLGNSVAVVPALGIAELAADLDRLIEPTVGPRDREFLGHLTLARVSHDAHCPVVGEPLAAEFDAAPVVLVASTLDPRGARHEPIGVYPLG